MPLGPVFDAELITTARRPRYYALRFAYGAVLLALIAARYRQIRWEAPDAGFAPTPQAMARFATGLFEVLNGVQAAAVLFLTPALVAGTIADERQRKTLHYLLASELSGAEIVGGKLAARLLHSMVTLAVGVPVLGLLLLFGGIDPRQVALSFAGAASTAFFVAGLSIFASAISGRVREAVALAYILELAWLIGPWVLLSLASGLPGAERFSRPALAWLLDGQPTALFGVGSWVDGQTIPRVAWMIGLQLAYGSTFVGLAVWRLRPGDRAVAAGGDAPGHRRRRRLLARPIGDDPMLWKECRVARSGGPLRVVWIGLGLMALTSLGYVVAGSAWSAFEELAAHGYGRGLGLDLQRRGDLKSLISLTTMAVSLVWVVAVASSAACGLTAEREEDTWISLIGTRLEGREILRAKRVGALLRPRGPALTLLALWAVGVAAGAIHPLAALALAAELLAVGGFATALGTYLSLRATTTARALAATLGVVFAIVVGLPVAGLMAPDNGEILFGFCPPILLGSSCVDHTWVRAMLGWGQADYDPSVNAFVHSTAIGLAATLAYGSAAWLLARRADLAFDRVVDRPRRPSRSRPSA